jgi:Spy/CpxP family protein refolding chaperone
VEALDLSQDQRDQMDEIYKKYLEDRPTPTERGARREPFTAALTAGDMKQARKNLDVLVEDTGAPVRAHGELKIHVLSLLTKEQHATLSRDHKDVITRSWIPRSGRMAGGPRGPRRPGPGARKAAQ